MYGLELPAHPPPTLLGGETSSWAEHCDAANLQQTVLTRAAAVAERLWSERRSATDVARQRLAAFRCRLLRRGLQASPVIPDACDAPVAPHPRPPNASAHLPPPPPTADEAPPPPPPPCVPHIPHAAPPARPEAGAAALALGACLLASVALNLVLGAGAWRRRREPGAGRPKSD